MVTRVTRRTLSHIGANSVPLQITTVSRSITRTKDLQHLLLGAVEEKASVGLRDSKLNSKFCVGAPREQSTHDVEVIGRQLGGKNIEKAAALDEQLGAHVADGLDTAAISLVIIRVPGAGGEEKRSRAHGVGLGDVAGRCLQPGSNGVQ